MEKIKREYLVVDRLVSALLPLRLEVRHFRPVSVELVVLHVVLGAASSSLLDAAEGKKTKGACTNASNGTANADFGTTRQLRPLLAHGLCRCLVDLLFNGGVTPNWVSDRNNWQQRNIQLTAQFRCSPRCRCGRCTCIPCRWRSRGRAPAGRTCCRVHPHS